MSSAQYDYVFVGASPLMCLFAAQVAKHNRVLLIDQRQQIGGSWQACEFDGKVFANTIPHMLDPHPGLYPYFEQILDVKMEDVSDHCFVAFKEPIFDKRCHPYSLYHLHRLCTREVFDKVKFMQGEGLTYPAFVQNVNRNNPMNLEHYRPLEADAVDVAFFEGGVEAFRGALEDKLEQTGCSVLLERRVVRVKVFQDMAFLELDDGSKITADSIQLSQHLDVPQIDISELGEFKPRRMTELQDKTLHVKLSGNHLEKFLYAYFPLADYLYVASCLDFHQQDGEEGVVYLAIILKDDFDITPTLVDAVVQELGQTGLITTTVKVEDHQVIEAPRTRFEVEDLTILAEATEGRVRVEEMAKTGGLARAIYDNLYTLL